jgi:amino acid transporter
MSTDSDSSHDTANQGSGWPTRLLRDVGVNIIANLAAGAIIYIFGTLAGFFPRSTVAIASAVVYLGFIAWFAFAVVGLTLLRRIRRHPAPSKRKVATAFLPMAGGVTVCGFVFLAVPFTSPNPAHPIFLLLYLSGAAFIALGVIGVFKYLKDRRKSGSGTRR